VAGFHMLTLFAETLLLVNFVSTVKTVCSDSIFILGLLVNRSSLNAKF